MSCITVKSSTLTLLLLCWFMTLTKSEKSTLNQTMELVHDLMENYDKRLRPVFDQFEVVVVNMNFSLDMIRSFDDVSGEISLLGTFEMRWLEERLQWSPGDYGNITKIILPKAYMWHPELFLKTSLNTLSQPGTSASKVSVSNDGKALLTSTDLLTSVCPVDVQHYPNDFQTCKLTTVPTGYSVDEIRLGKSMSVIHNIPANNEWNILEILTSAETGEFDITIKLQRRSMYGLMTMKIPIHLLGVMNLWVFFLPPDSGERTAFSITTFLAFTVYMGILTDNMPKGSLPVANLMLQVFIMLIYSASILFCTIISLQIHTNQGKKPVPYHIEKITKYLSFYFLQKRKAKVSNQDTSQNEIKRRTSAATQSTIVNRKSYFNQESLSAITDTDFPNTIPEDNLADASSYDNTMTWTQVGNTFDAYMLLLFIIWFMGLSIFYNTISTT